jgi:hypothetical protein
MFKGIETLWLPMMTWKKYISVKARNKKPQNVWIVLLKKIQIFEKSPWEHYISKIHLIFKINFYTFKGAITFFMKIHHVSRILLYF